jgi:hypothetical protein
MLRCAFLATIGLLTTTSLLFAQSPPTSQTAPAVESPTRLEAMEEAQTGDRWTYEFRDEITGEIKSTFTNTVTDVSASEIGVRTGVLGSANSGYLTFDRSWNMKANGTWRYSPNDGTGILAPLTVGKTWPIKATDVNSAAGISWKRSGTAKVAAQESVTTQAGTFDTFRIEATFQVQNAKDPTKKWQVVQQTWYAPAINHWVKRTYVSRSEGRVRDSNIIELVEYGRR